MIRALVTDPGIEMQLRRSAFRHVGPTEYVGRDGDATIARCVIDHFTSEAFGDATGEAGRFSPVLDGFGDMTPRYDRSK